ncbi:MAG: hypothetical protein WC852_05310, partial [Candidatus Nanoarchaeia archaeon]
MEQYSTSGAIQEAYLRHVDERVIESLESRAMHYSARARTLRLVEKVSFLPTAASTFFAGTEVFSGDYKHAAIAGAVAAVSVVAGIASRYFAGVNERDSELHLKVADLG